MAWVIPISTTDSDTIVPLQDTDDLYVAQGVVLASTTDYTALANGGGHDVRVYGTIVSASLGTAPIWLAGNPSTSTGSSIFIGETGRVESLDSGASIIIYGINSRIENHGYLLGNITLSDDSLTGVTTITNFGVIDGGFYRQSNSTETIVLTNSGTMAGVSNSFDSTGRDIVTNTGTISSSLSLGGGADSYDGHLGHFKGRWIDGSFGNDTIKGGADADQIIGGANVDLLSGGAGKDVFVFQTPAQSGANAANRDVITDFAHASDRISLASIDPVPGGTNEAFVFNAARGSATSAVATGHVGWYWEDNAGTANDHTIIKMNVDGDAAIESTIQLNGLISLTAGDFVL